MTEAPEAPQTSKPRSSSGEQEAAHQKIRSRRKAIALVSIVIALVSVPTLWGSYVSLRLSRAPVTLVRPHDYEAALEEILELQALALSEAKAHPPAFFVAHVGCAAPPVWQDEHVLENLGRMRTAGVAMTLFAGLSSNKGDPLPSADWPFQFRAKLMKTMNLKQKEVDAFYYKLPKELWNHSVVAGSERRSQAYITSHEEKNIYPTTYFIVNDNEACQEWKRYLLTKALTPDKPTSPPL